MMIYIKSSKKYEEVLKVFDEKEMETIIEFLKEALMS